MSGEADSLPPGSSPGAGPAGRSGHVPARPAPGAGPPLKIEMLDLWDTVAARMLMPALGGWTSPPRAHARKAVFAK